MRNKDGDVLQYCITDSNAIESRDEREELGRDKKTVLRVHRCLRPRVSEG